MRTSVLTAAVVALAIAQPSAEGRRWPGVVVGDVHVAGIVMFGLEGAAEWLKKPACQALFTEFRDQAGRPLAEKLAELNMDPIAYLAQVRFRDGSTSKSCNRRLTLMFTAPGNRVVFVCPEQLVQSTRSDPSIKSAVVLHETLHTLGLGENPPSSVEITHRIITQCVR